jgi:hypothetical protein
MYSHSSFYNIRIFQRIGPCLNYNLVFDSYFLSRLEQELRFLFENTVKCGFKGHLNSRGRGMRGI